MRVVGKQSTKKKIKQVITNFHDWARGCGYVDEDKRAPTDSKGIKPFLIEADNDLDNHPFLLPADVPRFIAALISPHSLPNVGSLALLFCILNCGRAAMVRGVPGQGVPPLTWQQIERKDGKTVLHIEAKNMKVKNAGDFEVTLSRQAVNLLEYVKRRGLSNPGVADAVIFPNIHGGALCENTMNKRIKSLDADDILTGGPGFRDPKQKNEKGESKIATQHGICRASFRTWFSDNQPLALKDVAETCLAHKVPDDQYHGAYNRSDYADARAKLLQDWADFCFSACSDHELNK